ncbi:MAG: PDZ domain-containing protein [Lachnospiraceae bacterium]|nr:PDZ domain-containing protein [Lachnospiraceae bacterium]
MTEKDNKNTGITPEESKNPQAYNPDRENQQKISNFMTEQIKQKPLNSRKLLRRTAITIVMAVIFGIVACVTFLFIQPIINRSMYPAEEAEIIEFPEESSEMSPEDMLVAEEDGTEALLPAEQGGTMGEALSEDTQAETEAQGNDSPTSENPEGAAGPGDTNEEGPGADVPGGDGTQGNPAQGEGDVPAEGSEGGDPTGEGLPEGQEGIQTGDQPGQVVYVHEPLNAENIAQIYASISELASQVNKSLVKVTAVTSDVNWFNDVYESSGQTTGLILADNGKQLIILLEKSAIDGADSIRVTFSTGFSAEATLQGTDSITGLAAIVVEKTAIKTSTLNEVQVATLGSSADQELISVGTPVLAVGSPYGSSGTSAFGMITGAGSKIDLPDSAYKLIRTDIYGSSNATGVLVNFEGNVVGIIDSAYNNEDTQNLISAVGITELKRILARLSNGKPGCYTGIYGTDVTNEIHLRQNIPFGAYVTHLDVSSPAMRAGIQSGDIITRLNNREILDYSTYVDVLYSYTPEDEVQITLQRFTKDEYREMTVTMTMGMR